MIDAAVSCEFNVCVVADVVFHQVKDMKLPAPTRGVNLVDVDEEIEGIDHRREEEEIQHIVPRVDIG